MSFRVERNEIVESGLVIFIASGRIQAENAETLRELMEREEGQVALDLEEVFLVDHDAVRFLAQCEAGGIELRNCPAFVREWVRQERGRSRRKPGRSGDARKPRLGMRRNRP